MNKKKLYVAFGILPCMAAGMVLDSLLNYPAYMKAMIVGVFVGALIYILLTIYKYLGIVNSSKRNGE